MPRLFFYGRGGILLPRPFAYGVKEQIHLLLEFQYYRCGVHIVTKENLGAAPLLRSENG